MFLIKLVRYWINRLTISVQNFLAPEEARLQKILELDKWTMKRLLPNSPVRIKDVHVLFDYNNKVVKLLVKSIKYKNNLTVKKRVADYFYEEIIDISSDITLFEGSAPVLVPMPMSKKEQINRGFNQCEEICREIAKLSENKINISYRALIKTKETKRQTTLNRTERILNVKNSMEADPNLVKNKTIIVLDDVYTTGASMEETRRALKLAGAKRVINFFIAH